MINRSAIAVWPKPSFLAWLKSVEDSNKGLSIPELEKTLYLAPDYEDPEDDEKVLKRVYDDILCWELRGWYRL